MQSSHAMNTAAAERFVDRDEYCQLLVSRKHLSRCDDPRARILGLLDSETGVRFVIEEDCLFRDELPQLRRKSR